MVIEEKNIIKQLILDINIIIIFFTGPTMSVQIGTI